ncbi:MAG: hypothetical protein WDM78_04060 [Puia sp.]
MDERLILESIERYIRGEMLPEERKFFEDLRKSNPGIDQLVVEHTVFLHMMEKIRGPEKYKIHLAGCAQ